MGAIGSRADKTAVEGEQREVPLPLPLPLSLSLNHFLPGALQCPLMMEGESKQELQTEEKGRRMEGWREDVRQKTRRSRTRTRVR